MKHLLITVLIGLLTNTAFAAKPCSQDDYTESKAKEHATEQDLTLRELTNSSDEVTAFLLTGEDNSLEAMYICGTYTHLYYGRGSLNDLLEKDEGDLQSLSNLEYPDLYQDEGGLSAEVLTLSKSEKVIKFKIYYLLFNYANRDAEDRGELFLTVNL